jgi:hypothetical protein
MPVTNQKTEKAPLYNQTSYQSVQSARQSLAERREFQKEIFVDIKKLPFNVKKMREDTLGQIQALPISSFEKRNLSESVNDYYDSFPTTSVYFVGHKGDNQLSYIVVRDDENDPGTKIPLSDLAKENTLFKYFNINQTTMELLPADRQMKDLNYLLNTSKSKKFYGEKKVRLNHLGQVRSFHSKQYKYIDHLEVLDKVKEFVRLDEASSFDIVLDEKFMLVYMVMKNHAHKKYKNDVISAGLCVYNSEVGLGSLQVYTSLNVNETRFVVKPTNSKYQYREVHKGLKKDPNATEALENFANHLDFANNYIAEVIAKYKSLYNIKIDNVRKTLDSMCNKFQQTRPKKIKQHLMDEADKIVNPTYRDLVHLIAELNVSKKHSDINFRHEMQKIAGDLINLSDEEILEML